MRKKWMLVVLVSMLVLAACGQSTGEPTTENNKTSNGGNAADQEEVTLSFFTALPDRESGMGFVEQFLIDAYVAENPHVTIEVEALQDEPYKNKIKIYASTNDMPDIIQSWGQPSFIDPLINNGLLHAFEGDYSGFNFIAGATDGFSKDGALYGLPKNTDILVLYYNKAIFEEHGLEPPRTEEELMKVTLALNEAGVNPIAINGMDGWTLPIWFEYVLQRETGSFDDMGAALHGDRSFTEEPYLAAAQTMQDFAVAGLFAEGFVAADYGEALNLFGQENAAMYLMGNWEMGLSQNEDFPESFRENVDVIPYPISDQSSAGDLAMWFGGGYSIGANSPHTAVAEDFLQFFFESTNWPKMAWEHGVATPAQPFSEFLTGDETELQQGVIDIFDSAQSASSTPVLDDATPQFKEEIMGLHQELLMNIITPEEFVERLATAAETAKATMEAGVSIEDLQ